MESSKSCSNQNLSALSLHYIILISLSRPPKSQSRQVWSGPSVAYTSAVARRQWKQSCRANSPWRLGSPPVPPIVASRVDASPIEGIYAFATRVPLGHPRRTDPPLCREGIVGPCCVQNFRQCIPFCPTTVERKTWDRWQADSCSP